MLGEPETGTYMQIRQLVQDGVLGDELCPTPHYWHWPVLKPDELPEPFKTQYNQYKEVRW